MSTIKIRAALEAALSSIAPALPTAWENQAFVPPASSAPYQRVHVLFATPDNIEIGATHIEQGFLQVALLYPLQAGTGAAAARAELIRTTFRRGSSFTDSGVVVNVSKTPEISAGTVDGDRWYLPVKIRFSAFIS